MSCDRDADALEAVEATGRRAANLDTSVAEGPRDAGPGRGRRRENDNRPMLAVDRAGAADDRRQRMVRVMTEKTIVDCRICRQPMFETEYGLMCRRALASWKWVGDHWLRSFAAHPESNPDERRYLEKHGLPD